jgi:ribonuclease Z
MARFFLTLSISFLGFFCASQSRGIKDSFLPDSTNIKVTLLGTGDPEPAMSRFGPSILVQAGNETLLFDAGRGCAQRLYQINVSYRDVNALFLTHLHSDHVVGIPDLWLSGWVVSRRDIPLPVFGPEGTTEMIQNLEKAFAFDIRIRIEGGKAPAQGGRLSAADIRQGTVYEKNGVKVTAFLVDHFPLVPAFGYRIEYKGHTVVLSGDTRYCENLIANAKGVDLLVHEVVISPETVSPSDPKYRIFATHTRPEQAGKIFGLVKPKLAVYSHIVEVFTGWGAQELYDHTKSVYSGAFVVGKDLMRFSVGDTVSSGSWLKEDQAFP